METVRTFLMTLENMFRVLFPARPSETLLNEVRALPHNPRTIELAGVKIEVFLAYREPPVRAAITEAKFYRHPRAIALLADVLQDEFEPPADVLVVPMPLSAARRRERGHNQVATVLSAAGIPCTADLLLREERPPQTSLAHSERAGNVRGAFFVPKAAGVRITGAHIVVIDDVVTTGATMAAARAVLEQHSPASITCVAFAH